MYKRQGGQNAGLLAIEMISLFDESIKKNLKELLKKMKVFCGTGGILIDGNIQLQGDMVLQSIEFLRKEGFHNL